MRDIANLMIDRRLKWHRPQGYRLKIAGNFGSGSAGEGQIRRQKLTGSLYNRYISSRTKLIIHDGVAASGRAPLARPVVTARGMIVP